MSRPQGVTQTRPPASSVVLRALGHRQLWNPSWELPFLGHEVGAQRTHRLLSSQQTLTWSLSSREDGSKSPGLQVHEMKPPQTLSQYLLQATSQPTAHSTPCSQPRLCLPWAHGGSGGSTLPQFCSPCPGVSDWPLMGEGLRTPRVSPEELRSPFPARSRAEAEAQLREG